MKRQILLSLAAVFVLTSLTGCVIEPRVFGIRESQWNTLSSEQREEVIRGYNERRRIEAQVEPINRAVDAAERLIRTKDRPMTRTKYVPVPTVNRSYSKTTVISTPPIHHYHSSPVRKETKVVKINNKRNRRPQSVYKETRVVKTNKSGGNRKQFTSKRRSTSTSRGYKQERRTKTETVMGGRKNNAKVVSKRKTKTISSKPSQGVSVVENVWEKESRLSRATSPARKSAVGGTRVR